MGYVPSNRERRQRHPSRPVAGADDNPRRGPAQDTVDYSIPSGVDRRSDGSRRDARRRGRHTVRTRPSRNPRRQGPDTLTRQLRPHYIQGRSAATTIHARTRRLTLRLTRATQAFIGRPPAPTPRSTAASRDYNAHGAAIRTIHPTPGTPGRTWSNGGEGMGAVPSRVQRTHQPCLTILARRR